jgi:ParB family chromosome partitioning protein
MDTFNHSQDDVAQIVGKSRSHVANTLRLLKLSEPVRAYVAAGKLSAGHARMLVGQPNADELANDIVNRGLNVRQVEAMARQSGKVQAKPAKAGKDADTRALEKQLSDALGYAVSIDQRGKGANLGGSVKISYRTLEQLDDIIRRLAKR